MGRRTKADQPTRLVPTATASPTPGNAGSGAPDDWTVPLGTTQSLPALAVTDLDAFDARIGGRYTVLSALGTGATSTVFRVRDEDGGGEWALKLLDADRGMEVERFRREQQLLRTLKHPNLIAVVDSGEWAGRQFMVMPLLTEGTLLEWLREHGRGGMDYRQVCALFRGAALGLHAAHEAGVVHRDVKPGNLARVTDDDGAPSLLVLDFGIAKSMNRTATLTDAGMVMGTPSYVCVERLFSGAKATPSWDVYSLGVVMYEMLTGRPLFRRPTWAETMNAIRRHTPPFVSSWRDDAPPALDWLVAEMLAKEPHMRPSGCDVVARRLERIAGELA